MLVSVSGLTDMLRAAHCLEGNVKVVMLSARTCSITQ
jgi:hypothetical protein